MASKKKLPRRPQLPKGFTPQSFAFPGDGLPTIKGSLFGCPMVAEVDGKEVPVRCPECAAPIVMDLSTILTLGSCLVDHEKRALLEDGLARGEMLCMMCQSYEMAAQAVGLTPKEKAFLKKRRALASAHVAIRDGDDRHIEFEGLEIWVVDRWGKTLENSTYAGPPSELKATLEALRLEKGKAVSVFAMAAGSTSWKQRYAI